MLLLVLVDGKNTMSGVFGAWGAFIRSAIRVCFSFAVNVLPAEPAKITTYISMSSLSIAESNKDFGAMEEVDSLEVKTQNSKACSQTERVGAEIKRKDGTCGARISKVLSRAAGICIPPACTVVGKLFRVYAGGNIT